MKQKRPDLILLDLMLPGMSGEKVPSQIQGIPIIVVSAKTDADSKVNLLLGGAVDYLTKPFDTKELLARLDKPDCKKIHYITFLFHILHNSTSFTSL